MWEDSSSLIYVHSEDQFKANEDSQPHLETICFPVGDVYTFESNEIGQEIDWRHLEPNHPFTACVCVKCIVIKRDVLFS